MLTQERLQSLLHYDPETGEWRWYIKRGRSQGRELAGYRRQDGYWAIVIDCRPYLAHRLAWLYVTGEFIPEIDHINRDRGDNRWANLRKADRSRNNANTVTRRRNQLGLKGVRRKGARFVAQISVDSRTRYLGMFETAAEAHSAYMAAARNQFGEFARAS